MENETTDKASKSEKDSKRLRLKLSLILLAIVVIAGVIALRGAIEKTNTAQKNTARRADYETVISNIKDFISEHGSYPDPLTTLPSDLLRGMYYDPDGNSYFLRMVYCGSGYIACPGAPKLSKGEILVIEFAKCSDNLVSLSDNPNDYVVWGYQDGTTPACVGSN